MVKKQNFEENPNKKYEKSNKHHISPQQKDFKIHHEKNQMNSKKSISVQQKIQKKLYPSEKHNSDKLHWKQQISYDHWLSQNLIDESEKNSRDFEPYQSSKNQKQYKIDEQNGEMFSKSYDVEQNQLNQDMQRGIFENNQFLNNNSQDEEQEGQKSHLTGNHQSLNDQAENNALETQIDLNQLDQDIKQCIKPSDEVESYEYYQIFSSSMIEESVEKTAEEEKRSNGPQPSSMIKSMVKKNMTLCGCKNKNCQDLRCVCRKNGRECNQECGCFHEECKNKAKHVKLSNEPQPSRMIKSMIKKIVTNENTSCRCKNKNCEDLRCVCKKNGRECNQECGCIHEECKNRAKHFPNPHQDSETSLLNKQSEDNQEELNQFEVTEIVFDDFLYEG